jgi:hypothetical protein
MSLILFLLAITAAIYGVMASNGLALFGALLFMAAGTQRLTSRAGEGDVRFLRMMGSRLLGQPGLFVFWLGVLLTLMAALMAREDDPALLVLALWLGGMLTMLVAGWLHDRRSRLWQRTADAVQWQRLDWALMAALFVVALALRLYMLDPYLPAMHGDEGEMGMLARLALYGPGEGLGDRALAYFRTGFLDHPTLFHYLQAGALALFGDNIIGLKVLSALFGALCAPTLFAIGRLGWGRAAGLVAGWLLAVSHLHIHYSRIALNNIESVWLMAMLVLLAVMAWVLGAIPGKRTTTDAKPPVEGPVLEVDVPVQGENPPHARMTIFIVLGLVVGLSQYFYYGSRLLAILAIPIMLILWRTRRATFEHLVVATAGSVAAFLPLMVFYFDNLAPFINRMRGVSVFNPDGLVHTLGPDAVWPNDIPALFLKQVELNLRLFIQGGDRSAFYVTDIPAFDVVTVALVWLGFGVILTQWRRFPAQVVALWFLLGVFFGGVLTNDAPNGPRLIVAIPAIFVAAGAGAQIFYNLLHHIWAAGQTRVALAVATVLAAVTLQLNYVDYFVDFRRMQIYIAVTDIGRIIHNNRDTHEVYLMGSPNLFVEYGTIRFLADGARSFNLFTPAEFPPLLDTTRAQNKDALVIALPFRYNDLLLLQEQYPGSTIEQHFDNMERLTFYTYEILE